MTMTLALIVNAVLVAGIVAALAAVVRLAHRLPEREQPETLHPSQPLPRGVIAAWNMEPQPGRDEERELAHAA